MDETYSVGSTAGKTGKYVTYGAIGVGALVLLFTFARSRGQAATSEEKEAQTIYVPTENVTYNVSHVSTGATDDGGGARIRIRSNVGSAAPGSIIGYEVMIETTHQELREYNVTVDVFAPQTVVRPIAADGQATITNQHQVQWVVSASNRVSRTLLVEAKIPADASGSVHASAFLEDLQRGAAGNDGAVIQVAGATVSPAPFIAAGAGAGSYVAQPVQVAPEIFAPSSARSYRVVPGDTLWSIAQRVYGFGDMWPQLYDRNRGILTADMGVDGAMNLHPSPGLTLSV